MTQMFFLDVLRAQKVFPKEKLFYDDRNIIMI